eukprot:gene6011-biopygen2980
MHPLTVGPTKIVRIDQRTSVCFVSRARRVSASCGGGGAPRTRRWDARTVSRQRWWRRRLLRTGPRRGGRGTAATGRRATAPCGWG